MWPTEQRPFRNVLPAQRKNALKISVCDVRLGMNMSVRWLDVCFEVMELIIQVNVNLGIETGCLGGEFHRSEEFECGYAAHGFECYGERSRKQRTRYSRQPRNKLNSYTTVNRQFG